MDIESKHEIVDDSIGGSFIPHSVTLQQRRKYLHQNNKYLHQYKQNLHQHRKYLVVYWWCCLRVHADSCTPPLLSSYLWMTAENSVNISWPPRTVIPHGRFLSNFGQKDHWCHGQWIAKVLPVLLESGWQCSGECCWRVDDSGQTSVAEEWMNGANLFLLTNRI